MSSQKFYNLSNADEVYTAGLLSKKEKKRVRVRHQAPSLKRFNAAAQRVVNAGGKRTLELLVDYDDRHIKQTTIRLLSQYFEMRELQFSTSSEDDSDPVEMFDENGNQLEEDGSSEPSVETRDEMALCEDLACKI